MSTLVEVKAKDANVGQEYTSPKGSTVKVMGQKGDKTVIMVKVPGYDYKGGRAIEVPGSYLLKGASNGNGGNVKKETAEAKKTAKAERHAAKAAEKEAVKAAKKEAKVAKPSVSKGPAKDKPTRHPRMETLITVMIKGVKFRGEYRNRLSQQRALLCQKAEKDHCFCRCGGLLHGKSHKSWFEAEDQLFTKYNGPVPAGKIVQLAEELAGKQLSVQEKK